MDLTRTYVKGFITIIPSPVAAKGGLLRDAKSDLWSRRERELKPASEIHAPLYQRSRTLFLGLCAADFVGWLPRRIVPRQPQPSRIPLPFDAHILGSTLPILVIVVFCVQDWRTNRRIHPVYLAALPLFIGMELLAAYLYTQHPARWVAAAGWMIGV